MSSQITLMAPRAVCRVNSHPKWTTDNLSCYIGINRVASATFSSFQESYQTFFLGRHQIRLGEVIPGVEVYQKVANLKNSEDKPTQHQPTHDLKQPHASASTLF